MIGNGIEADLFSLLKIKQQLAKVIGFGQSTLVPNAAGTIYVRFKRFKSIPEAAFPCLHGLLATLDVTTLSTLPPSAMGASGDVDTTTPCHIGAIFVDIVLSVITHVDFQTTSYLTCKSLLDMLLIIIYKVRPYEQAAYRLHADGQQFDITRRSLRHLQETLSTAVESVTRTIRMEISYDVKSGAFSVAQALLKRWPPIVIKILGYAPSSASQLDLFLTSSQSPDIYYL